MTIQQFIHIPDFRADSLSLETLETIVKLLKDHHIKEIKVSARHQIAIPEADQPNLQAISQGLQKLIPKPAEPETRKEPSLKAIRTCPDAANCKHGILDTAPITDMVQALELPGKLPAKVKVSVAGCKMCCTAPFVRDLGLVAERKGWKLIFGGNSGSRPRIGDVIADGLSDSQAIELILRCLTVYINYAKPKMRTARFMEYYDADRFKSEVLKTFDKSLTE